VSATQIFGRKTGSIPTPTPLGTIDFAQNLNGPRASLTSTWTIYSAGVSRRRNVPWPRKPNRRAPSSRPLKSISICSSRRSTSAVELAANVERTRASLLQAADRHLERATRFEQQGLIARVERLNAQVARDEAAREHVRARSDREIAQARLQRLLHRDAPIEATTSLFVIKRNFNSLPEWLSTAERQNPVLAAFDARREQAKQSIAIAESRWKPEIFAFGTYALIKHYQTITEPNWIAGIGISFTLFSREDRASKVSAARESLRQVTALEEETRNVVDTAVETAYRRVYQAREQFELLDSTLAAARENLRLRERGFDEGQATSLDVNDARTG
jgi:outer membrane protein TolC